MREKIGCHRSGFLMKTPSSAMFPLSHKLIACGPCCITGQSSQMPVPFLWTSQPPACELDAFLLSLTCAVWRILLELLQTHQDKQPSRFH